MEIKQIKETCLYVQDLDRTKAFYHDILGLPLYSHVKDRHIFFKAGTSMLLCFLPEVTKAEQNLPPHYAYGKQHIAFEVSAAVYNKWKKQLLSKEIKIIHQQHWRDDLHSFYFEDPNGHLLEIVPEGIWD